MSATLPHNRGLLDELAELAALRIVSVEFEWDGRDWQAARLAAAA